MSKVLQDMPKKHKGYASMPASNHLFEVRKTARNISEEDAQTFHTLMSKLLFLRNQEWTDVITGVVFLTTIVRDPNKDYEKRLGCVLKYPQITKYIMLTL